MKQIFKTGAFVITVAFIFAGIFQISGCGAIKGHIALNMGKMAYDQKDYVTAVKKYQEGAAKGNIVAQYRLACMYSAGEGVSSNQAIAEKWMRSSAGQGYPAAQFVLGLWYLAGIGVDRDEVKAVKWLRKAADQKEKFAQYHLGLVYATGRGVLKNPDEALKWFRLASANGCPVPKNLLTKEGISKFGEGTVAKP